MSRLPITFACGPYDRTEALRLGVVQPEGIDLRYLAIRSPPEIFARMVKTRSFDVSEMSLAHYFLMRLRLGDAFPYVALPVFPSRLFRHGYIFINTRSGIETPKDLEGRRVGVQEYRQTAGVWIRGILRHEYGVDLDTIRWVEGGVNTPRRPDAEMDLRPAGELTIELAPEGRCLSDMLERGEVEAYFGARRPDALKDGNNVARLFPNYREVERAYYLKTGHHPIMHTVVMHADLYRANPWIAESLFKACVAAKRWALEQMRFSGAPRFMLPWMFDEIAEMDELFGGDPWPYGVETNRHSLEAFMGFLVDQHFLDEAAPIDELFAPIVGWSE